jgi:hypothetical protein
VTSPEFVSEMNRQLARAREYLDRAMASGDAEGAAMARDRIAELAELTDRNGVDVEHIDLSGPARVDEPVG